MARPLLDSVSSAKPQTLKDTEELLRAEAVLTAVSAHQEGWRHQSAKAWTLYGFPKAIFTLPAVRLLGVTSGQV